MFFASASTISHLGRLESGWLAMRVAKKRVAKKLAAK